MKERYGRRGDLERVAPGTFQESASGRRVFFLDKDTPDNKSGKNIFISTIEHGKETVTSARTGRVVTEGDSQYLLLSNGQRLETSLSGQGMKISEFEEYGNRVGSNELGPGDDSPAKARSTFQLLLEPSAVNRAELAWRIGQALAALNFVILAITVSSVNPRVGRSGNLVFALFAFVVYFNLLNMGHSWITSGRASFAGFLLGLHGTALAFGLFWLAKQHNNWSVAGLLRRQRA
jgi:lipopolysaccharide export system permease protein